MFFIKPFVQKWKHVIFKSKTALKKRNSSNHFVKDNTKWPNITLVGIIRSFLQNLRCAICYRSAKSAWVFNTRFCCLLFARWGHQLWESEVTNFNMFLLINKYIFKFDVAVRHSMRLQILKSWCELEKPLFCLFFSWK